MKKIGLLGLLIVLLLSACGPQASPVPETQETSPAPVEQPTEVPTEEVVPVKNCQYGACVQDVIMAKSENNLLVFFDLTDQNGEVVLGEEKFFMGNILAAGYLIPENGAEETLFQAELGGQDYNCYSGEDLPWNPGIPTATCGFSVPLSELRVAPEIGDRVRIELPGFEEFKQEVIVQERAALE